MKKSYIQINGKLVPKNEATYQADHKLIIAGDIEPFKSPINGEVIMGRSHLRRHMKEHGVTHSSDYSDDWFQQRRNEINRQQEREGRAERINVIRQKMGII